MSFRDRHIENFIPNYFNSETKDRLKTGLSDFFYSSDREKNYSGFYSFEAPAYLMQADILHSIRTIDWDEESQDYFPCFFPAIVISNTCDITDDNIRSTNIKQALLAPFIPVEEYLKDMQVQFKTEQIRGFYNSLKRQEHSNLFYLPSNHKNNKDYIVFLDKIYWHPVNSLAQVTKNLEQERFLSLSNWGFYLFLLKLSYHLCRLPEDYDGRNN